MDRLENHQPYLPKELPVTNLTDHSRERYFPLPVPGEWGAERYGFLGNNNRGFYAGISGNSGRRLPASSRNYRYMNVNQFFDNAYGTDYRQMLIYDRLDKRNFPVVFEELADGVFGALLIWPEQPGIVIHSAALEKLFIYLDRRLKARLAYANGVPEERRIALARELVKETLKPLVNGIMVENDLYKVSFRLPNGHTSPWVEVPLVFFNGTQVNAQASLYSW
jgi:hypothetical protein